MALVVLGAMNRTRAQADGLILLNLGALIFVLLGITIVNVHRDISMDFGMAHSSARCLIKHCDAYKQSDLQRMYLEVGGRPPVTQWQIESVQFETLYVYFPTVFLFTLPFATLPYLLSYIAWVIVIAASFILASFLMWDIGKEYAPLLTGALLCFYLANSASLISSGNPGGIALSLCVVSVWCFFRERLVFAGVLCLALSLAIKPHDSSLVWLFFIVAGGSLRKRALQSLAAFAVLTTPVLLWVTHIAPHWFDELRSNMATLSMHGAVSDPGPSTALSRGTLSVTNLQSAVSLIRDDPHFYNAVSYAICALLLAILLLVTFRFRPSGSSRWIALAIVSVLTLLPIYHRQYDSKLLILTIPPCVMLWSRGGWKGKLALLTTASGLLVTADLPWAFFLVLTSGLRQSDGASDRLLIASLAAPVPCTLLLVASVFLWIYTKQSRQAFLASEEFKSHELLTGK